MIAKAAQKRVICVQRRPVPAAYVGLTVPVVGLRIATQLVTTPPRSSD
jgi:hypothetical protein